MLQEYSYNMWKKHNTFIHGENKKGHSQQQYALCQDRIRQLYKMDRSILSHADRAVFNLPLSQRLKQGMQGLALWINMVEMLFDDALNKKGSKLENPMFKRKKQQKLIKIRRKKPVIARVKPKKKKKKWKHIAQAL